MKSIELMTHVFEIHHYCRTHTCVDCMMATTDNLCRIGNAGKWNLGDFKSAGLYDQYKEWVNAGRPDDARGLHEDPPITMEQLQEEQTSLSILLAEVAEDLRKEDKRVLNFVNLLDDNLKRLEEKLTTFETRFNSIMKNEVRPLNKEAQALGKILAENIGICPCDGSCELPGYEKLLTEMTETWCCSKCTDVFPEIAQQCWFEFARRIVCGTEE